MLPTLSGDGLTLVFRHLFHFYSLKVAEGSEPKKLIITAESDLAEGKFKRRWYDSVYSGSDEGWVDFSKDGEQICFSTGGDIWVMDKKRKKPVAITNDSAFHDSDCFFSPDQNSIFMLRDHGDQVAIWRAQRADDKLSWAQNRPLQARKNRRFTRPHI